MQVLRVVYRCRCHGLICALNVDSDTILLIVPYTGAFQRSLVVGYYIRAAVVLRYSPLQYQPVNVRSLRIVTRREKNPPISGPISMVREVKALRQAAIDYV